MEDKLKMKNNMKVFNIIIDDLFAGNKSGNNKIKQLADMITMLSSTAIVCRISPEEIMAMYMFELSIMFAAYRDIPGLDGEKFDKFVDKAFVKMKKQYKKSVDDLANKKRENKI